MRLKNKKSMKKNILQLSIWVLLLNNSYSQQIAKWTYKSSFSNTLDTTTTVIYEKDTILEGIKCQKMKIHYPNTYGLTEHSQFFIYKIDNKVYEYPSKDILYDFDTEIDDFWITSNKIKVIVDSVSYLKVDDHTLKQLHVRYKVKRNINGFYYDYCSVITEKLGDHTWFINRKSWINPDYPIQTGKYLMQYSEKEFTLNNIETKELECKKEEILNTYFSEDLTNKTFLYPNPTTDDLHIKLEHGDYDIEIRNLENIVLQKQQLQINHSSNITINVSDLSYGIYVLKLNEQFIRFIKE
jgi:hypothetical protein